MLGAVLHDASLFKPTAVVLSIAGSDCTAGAGIQADIKTAAALGVFACTAITAVTAQNTRGVRSINAVSPAVLHAQIDAVMADYPVAVIKLGLLGSLANANWLADFLPSLAIPVIIDPVLQASVGGALNESLGAVVTCYRERLLPLATLVTPNIPEALQLLSCDNPTDHEGLEHLALQILGLGAKAVLLKGGHAEDPRLSTDYLAQSDIDDVKAFSAVRLVSPHGHGTGCTLATAIAAGVAQGLQLPQAVAQAKNFVQGALLHAGRLQLVPSQGPLHHLHSYW